MTAGTGTIGSDCDSRIWSGACERDSYSSESEKYLCTNCGRIAVLSHAMHHEGYPHIVGDEGNLS